MSDEEREDTLSKIVDARNGRSALSAAADLGDVSGEDLALAEAADLLWLGAQEIPALENDPVALMLGLVPSPEFALDPKALTRCRKQARISVSALAARLTARGWSVSGPDILRWETKSAADVPPAIIRAVADELDVDATSLGRRESEDPARVSLQALFKSPDFEALVQRLARVQHVSTDVASSMLRSRALSAVHRGGAPDSPVALAALEVLVRTLEQSGGTAT